MRAGAEATSCYSWVVPPTFIRLLIPADAARPPPGEAWLHEPKWDGYRFQVVKAGDKVRLFSKSGAEYTDRLPGMVDAFTDLPARSAVLEASFATSVPTGMPTFIR